MNLTGFKALTIREVKRFMRIPAQTILPPIISSALFILIFGSFIGGTVGEVEGVPYILFFVPGLVMLNVITSSYSNSAFSLFIMRFLNHIGDILTAPLSYLEIVLAFVIGAVIRGLIVGILIFMVSMFFVELSFHNIFLTLFMIVITSIIFASIGLIVGLWAREFEHLELFTTFLITPLVFLGGVFHSVEMLPDFLKGVTYLNPFFYLINGLRYSVIGTTETNLLLSVGFPVLLAIIFFSITVYLFKKGYNLRT